MKKNDLWFLAVSLAVFSPFFILKAVQSFYLTATTQHPLLMSFAKFAVLATLGEIIGLRISQGVYCKAGFGLLPRGIFWGFTGVLIKIAFVIFASGAPAVIDHFFYKLPAAPLAGDLTATKGCVAFTISACLNLMFAPLFMTLHKVSDIHIEETGGTLRGYVSGIDFAIILQKIDWSVMWGFVFKKTIPLFWIPAHTVTFLLPPDFQVLFAALLGIILGIVLAVAGKQKQNTPLAEAVIQ